MQKEAQQMFCSITAVNMTFRWIATLSCDRDFAQKLEREGRHGV